MDLNDNELGFNPLSLEANSLFNDELNLNSISHDYIKNGDDLFLTNENWLSSLDNDENAFNHTSLSNVNQTQGINHNQSENDQLNQSNRVTNTEESNQNSILFKKKRKHDPYDNNLVFMNPCILNNEVDNVIEISDLGINQNQRLKSVDNRMHLNQRDLDKLSLNKKAGKLLGKPIKDEYVQEQIYNEKENNIKEELESDQEELDNDLDEDEEDIDDLLKFPVSSSIFQDEQCGSPSELNQLNLLHDSDSGSAFDDGYLSATSTFNLNTNSQQLPNENRRQIKGTNANLLANQQSTNPSNDQLFQVHNYSCIKQDKFLHSANNQQLIANSDNQLVYLKHDGFINGSYTSSNSSLSGGSQSSSPTQSPKARKSNYGRRQLKGSITVNDDQQPAQRQNGVKSSSTANLKGQQTSGRGSRFKPITDVCLTDEERRLLNKEGYVNFPNGDNPQLSKMEEKILRKIRRKIRNKRSAQCSRQRKKEYLEELEKKYSTCTNELQGLKSEVQKLRKEKVSLIGKLEKLMRKLGNQPNQPNRQNLNLDEDDLNSNHTDSNNLGEELPAEITCGENIQINKIVEQNQTQLDQNLTVEASDNSGQASTSDCLVDNLELDDDCLELITKDDLNDDLFTNYLLNSSNDDLQFDFENFEINNLKDDGLLHYVNNFTNDNQLIIENNNQLADYHQQAPVKTSLFILVLFFVIMFVPFLRPDILDHLDNLNYLENQIESSKELISSNQLTAIL